MNELLSLLPSGTATTASALVIAMIAIATYLPKLLNSIKSDKIDGSVLERIAKHEERMNDMDRTIHRQAIKLTRLTVVLLHVKMLLNQHKVPVPEHLQKEMDELTELEQLDHEERTQ